MPFRLVICASCVNMDTKYYRKYKKERFVYSSAKHQLKDKKKSSKTILLTFVKTQQA